MWIRASSRVDSGYFVAAHAHDEHAHDEHAHDEHASVTR
jgi:hypothetical protein